MAGELAWTRRNWDRRIVLCKGWDAPEGAREMMNSCSVHWLQCRRPLGAPWSNRRWQLFVWL